MKILDVGCNKFDRPAEMWPDEERDVTRLDIDPETEPDILHDINQPLPEKLWGRFDVVIASHVLEHLSWRTAVCALGYLGMGVRDGGSLWVLVPDIEWAARAILKGDMGLGVLGIIYGGQCSRYDFHACGFTQDMLRVALARLGWRVKQMYTTGVLVMLNGKQFEGQQIVVEAKRANSQQPTGESNYE